MARRGRTTARIDRVALHGRLELDLGNGGGAVVLRDGRADLPDGTRLGRGDTILGDPSQAGRTPLTGTADLVVIRFCPANGETDHPAAGG